MLASRNTVEFYVGSGGWIRLEPAEPAVRRPLRPGGRVPEEAPVRELVDAAVAERVAAQQPPAGQDRPADRTELANRLDRVGRAGRVVAAARREGRVRSSAGRARIGAISSALEQAFHDKRSSARGVLHELRQRAADAILTLTLEQTLRPRPGDDHVVASAAGSARRAPRTPRGRHASPCSGSRPCRSSGPPRARAARRPRTRPRGGRRSRRPGSGWRTSCPLGRRDRSRRSGRDGGGGHRGGPRRPTLGSEALAALLTPAPQDRATGTGTAARSKPVGPGSLALLRLVGPLHRKGPNREGEGHGSIGRGHPAPPASASAAKRRLRFSPRFARRAPRPPLSTPQGRAYDRPLAASRNGLLHSSSPDGAPSHPTRGGPGSGAGR